MSWVTSIANAVKKAISKPMSYADMYSKVVVKPERIAEVKYAATRILAGKANYQEVVKSFPGMPYWYVGVIHLMEGGGNFKTHLHNGDPLSARTTHVPAGRPKMGAPPFKWAESAVDALIYTGHLNVTDWSIQNCLDLLEKYNGMGYKKRGVPSPYLWSFSQFYSAGKFVKDGIYDKNFISKQPGVACVMKLLGV